MTVTVTDKADFKDRVRGWAEMFPHVRNFHERIYTRIHEHAG